MDFIIDLGAIENTEDLHDLLAKTFDFPEYYGRNLNALFDLITEGHEFWNIEFKNTAPAKLVLGEEYYQALKETFADAEIDFDCLKAVWDETTP